MQLHITFRYVAQSLSILVDEHPPRGTQKFNVIKNYPRKEMRMVKIMKY